MTDAGAEDGLVMRWLKALVQRIRFWRRPPVAVGFLVVIGGRREMIYQQFAQPGETVTQRFDVPLVLRDGDAIDIVIKAVLVQAPDPNYSKPWWPWSHL